MQVLNKLAANDNNKKRIVDCGALPYYVQLMQSKWTEVEHAEAAHGIWTLAFKCKDRLLKEDGCVKGKTSIVTWLPIFCAANCTEEHALLTSSKTDASFNSITLCTIQYNARACSKF
jgi:hypothetical protein